MARTAKSLPVKSTKPRRRRRTPKISRWLLQDAKARFSELVRRVHSEGPQRVAVDGRDEVVVISAEIPPSQGRSNRSRYGHRTEAHAGPVRDVATLNRVTPFA